jgi:Bacterial pre-peptidase C-terminal domain
MRYGKDQSGSRDRVKPLQLLFQFVKGRIQMKSLRSHWVVLGWFFASLCSPAWATVFTPGSTLTGTISSAAQTNYYTFTASSGDIWDFTIHSTSGNLSPALQLVDPGGNVVASANTNQGDCGSSDAEMNSVELNTSGTYTLEVSDCSEANSGNYAVYAQRVNNPAGAVKLIFGQPQSGTIGSAAQSITYTFSANAGDVVDFTVYATAGTLSPKIILYNPGGAYNSSVNTNQGDCGNPDAELNGVTLPTTGTYIVLIGDCSDFNTGTYEIYTQRTNNPGGPFAQTFGQTQSGTIGSAAQSITYTFSANAGDVVDFTVHTTVGTLSPKIILYNPGGTYNTSTNTDQGDCGNPDAELNGVTLPTTGTYIALIGDCSDSNTGSYEIYTQKTDNPGGPPLVFGQPQSSTIGSAAQSNTYTFSANAGDVVDFTVYATAGTLSPKITLYNPGGAYNSSVNTNQGDCGSPDAELNGVMLSTTGTYTVLIGDCSDFNTGTYEIYTQRTNNPGGPISLTFGQPKSGTVSSAAQSITYTFSANAGDVVDFTVHATAGTFSPKIILYNPGGTYNTSTNTDQGDCGNPDAELNGVTLPTTGTYIVLIGDCSDSNIGSYEIYTQRITNPSGAISILWGQTQASNIGVAAYSSTYTFEGATGEKVNLTVAETSGQLSPKIDIYNPDGTLLASANTNQGDCGSSNASLTSIGLGQSGSYTVLVGDCGDINTGNYSLQSQCFSGCPLPAPTLSLISPTNALAGGTGFTETVNGSNFVNANANSVVQWNGNPLPTTWVNTGQMTAQVPAADIACAGTYEITVFTPAPGGGTSAPISFSVVNPVPVLQSISPTSILAGSSSFTLTVNGSSFVQCPSLASEVMWNGISLATTYVNGSQLTAIVPMSYIVNGGKASVTVFNPGPGGGTSSPVQFTVNNPVPVLNSISPTSTTVGGAGFTLTLNGSSFISSSTVNWNTNDLAPTHVSASQLTVMVPGSYLQSAGTALVSVTNPGPGGGTSAQQAFTINKDTPVITWQQPAPITYGTTLAAILDAAASFNSSVVSGSFSYTATPAGGTASAVTASTVPPAGSYTLTATFTPTDSSDYVSGGKATVSLTVSKAAQTIAFPQPTSPVIYGVAPITLLATATSGLTVTFTIDASSTGKGTISGSILTVTGAGNLVIDANQAGNANYAAASQVQRTVVVNQAAQMITFPQPTSPVTYAPGLIISLSATGGASGNPVVFTIDANSTGKGTISGSTLTVTQAGKLVIDANQAGNANYAPPLPVQRTVVVNQAAQAITFQQPLSPVTYEETLPLSATATSGLTVTFTLDPSSTGKGTISGGILNVTGVGTLVIDANQTGNINYAPALPVQRRIVVNPASPTIDWPTPAPITYPMPLTATQLDAGASFSPTCAPTIACTALVFDVPGTYVYSPPAGTVLNAGVHTLCVTFTPTDNTDYKTATYCVPLTVNQATSELQFVPVTPCRIADTRNAAGAFGGPELSAASTREFDIPLSSCNIPASASAYSLNVTVVPITSLGYLTIWPAGQAQPNVSTLNSTDGRVKANATITPAGANGGVNVYASDATQFILDIDGYFVPAGINTSGLEFYPVTPCRVADTRNASGGLGGPSLAANTGRAFPVQSSACGIPSTAKAYSLNITAVPHGSLGYLTAWPTGEVQPVVSTLNATTGAVTANAAIVPAGTSGDVSIVVSDAADVILDVNGYFAPPATGGLSLYTVTPCRVLDTRNGSGPLDGTLTVPVHTSSCAPPATAQAYVMNATVLPTATLGYLTLWADGATQPDVSTLNASDGAITSNMAIVPTTNGAIDVFSTDSTNLLLDLSSYFAP